MTVERLSNFRDSQKYQYHRPYFRVATVAEIEVSQSTTAGSHSSLLSRTVAVSHVLLALIIVVRHFLELSPTVALCHNPRKPFLACDFVEFDHLSRSVAALLLTFAHDPEQILHRALERAPIVRSFLSGGTSRLYCSFQSIQLTALTFAQLALGDCTSFHFPSSIHRQNALRAGSNVDFGSNVQHRQPNSSGTSGSRRTPRGRRRRHNDGCAG